MEQAHTTTSSNRSIRPWISVGLALLGVASFFIVSNFVGASAIRIHENAIINQNLLYQSSMLVIALIVMGLLYWLYPQNFRRFVRFGDMGAKPEPVRWLGISEKDTWRGVGINFAVIITLATSAFLYFGLWNPELPLTALLAALPWALLFAVSNSFVEETITRFTIVIGLAGTLEKRYLYILSALVFGIPHYFGVPGGVIGSLMAAFLGWLLAKSIVETRGIFWAWFIHFLQDVVIFAVLISVVA